MVCVVFYKEIIVVDLFAIKVAVAVMDVQWQR
jgi:hypothetical protein